jgi:hypothetical protein
MLVEWMDCEGRGDIWEEMQGHDIMSLKVPTEMKIDRKFAQRRSKRSKSIVGRAVE